MSDISLDRAGSAEQSGSAPALYRAVWRWHFYAGLYVVPFLLMLAVTGLIMLWIGVLDGRDGERSLSVAPGQPVAVSVQADAALAAVPGGTLKQYLAPLAADRPALFRVDRGDDARMVAVDPSTGQVLDSWLRRAGWYVFADEIHGTLLIGTVGDRMIEIAAGFGVVLVVTGLYLWWPRGESGLRRMLVPNLAARGRRLMKSLHGTLGFYLSVVLLAFLVSGMSWTGIWGEKYTQAWSTFPAAKWDAVPLSDETHAAMNHGAMKEVPWALEQTPMPASGSMAGHAGMPAGTAVDIDTIAALAKKLGFGAEGRFQVNLPSGETGVWTISQDSMSDDSPDPTVDRTVHVDRFTGRILADVGFADYSLPGKAMAVAIALHQGDMGGWNVALNTLFCLAVIVMAASGIVLWWMRRPKGRFGLAAPVLHHETVPMAKGVVLLTLLLSALFPLVGATLLAVLALDLLVIRRIPALRRVLD
ncbi:PepSY domain-containing protein [Aurantimonas sp. 22II-16-19i]|uniref:PepSY-associated TM helix domain-containing protein n=1 Tax=Aurantimonas sp. 22II-16-19i TaxID=1317114 RepID=UPI0009F7E728|nr:PepSY domain-containing protein [Aurantimonas sp. 22II-16-19i]ORE97604.1 integral membrane protein [Aurantimonas sp. 22II-16-19i]